MATPTLEELQAQLAKATAAEAAAKSEYEANKVEYARLRANSSADNFQKNPDGSIIDRDAYVTAREDAARFKNQRLDPSEMRLQTSGWRTDAIQKDIEAAGGAPPVTPDNTVAAEPKPEVNQDTPDSYLGGTPAPEANQATPDAFLTDGSPAPGVNQDSPDGYLTENTQTSATQANNQAQAEGAPQDDEMTGGINPSNQSTPTGKSSPDVNTATGTTGNNGQKEGTAKNTDPYGTRLRKENPLSHLSSYTYQISLYMVTPECYNDFVAKDGLNSSSSGYYIVAQSGGINTQVEPRALTQSGELGPGQPGMDFFIEDLNIETLMVAMDNQKTATVSSDCNFKIIEPSGFTFPTRMIRAAKKINEISPIIQKAKNKPTLYQQLYIIGVRFYGYDVDGALLPSEQILGSNGAAAPEKSLYDPYSIYERFFPITIGHMKFRIDGRATVYNISSLILPLQVGFGMKHGTLPAMELEGDTVGKILGSKKLNSKKSLIGEINDIQERFKSSKNQERVIVYDIEWETDSDIPKASMLTDPEYAKETAAMSKATKTSEVTPAMAAAAVTINVTSKKVSIPAGINVASAIDQIIAKSNYVTDKLIKKNNQRIETDTLKNQGSIELEWYSVHPKVICTGRDDENNCWVYNITYQIRKYKVPYIISQYPARKTKYYGPHKEYLYWYTGKNTEIISYEHDYDNLYYVITPHTTSDDDSAMTDKQGRTTPVGVHPNDNGNATGGTIRGGSKVNDNVRASLYDTASQAQATIKILGDPDFLMQTVGTGGKFNSDSSYPKLYGADNTVNPLGGQIFAEIQFGVAEDYLSDGTMDADPGKFISFYDQDLQTALNKESGNQGLIYRINKVNSAFSRGKFEQQLELQMVPKQSLEMPGAFTKPSDTDQELYPPEPGSRQNQSASAPAARDEPPPDNTGSSTPNNASEQQRQTVPPIISSYSDDDAMVTPGTTGPSAPSSNDSSQQRQNTRPIISSYSDDDAVSRADDDSFI